MKTARVNIIGKKILIIHKPGNKPEEILAKLIRIFTQERGISQGDKK